jgi:hypothetical protein
MHEVSLKEELHSLLRHRKRFVKICFCGSNWPCVWNERRNQGERPMQFVSP